MRSSHFTRKTPEYRLSGNKKALNSVSSGLKILVPVAGLEPARIAPPHFELFASYGIQTNSNPYGGRQRTPKSPQLLIILKLMC